MGFTLVPRANVVLGCFSSSWDKAHQNGLRLLCCIEDTFELGLGGFQFGLFVFARATDFGQCVFDLGDGRIIVEGLLQGLLFLAGLRGSKGRTAAWAAGSR